MSLGVKDFFTDLQEMKHIPTTATNLSLARKPPATAKRATLKTKQNLKV